MDRIPNCFPYEIKKELRKRKLEKAIAKRQLAALIAFIIFYFFWAIFFR